jgi:hypothetical protein
MKKKLLIIVIASLSYFFCIAQNKNEITALYLLPFHLNEISQIYTSFKNSADINQVKQFEMMGFWLGAKIALQEYNDSDKKINVIVRDAVTNVSALTKLLEDTVLMKPVNLIIGPFYGSLFPVAAEYAKNHNIIIVNPFSTRYDFVESNPKVFKLVSPFVSRPEILSKQFLSNPNEYNVILWGDSTTTPELLAYKYYFNENHIPYKEVNTITLPQTRKKDLIIALFSEPHRVINCVHTLIAEEEETDNVVVAPEKWISISELNEDFFNLPNLYYFTDYFVDEKDDKVRQFQHEYLFNYEVPATLADYSYQGYDITRYFIDLFFADFCFDAVEFHPLSYQFQWKQILEGGFENITPRLIQIVNFELEEMK